MSSKRQWNSSHKKKETEKDHHFINRHVEKDTIVKELNMVIGTPNKGVNGSWWDISLSHSSSVRVSWQHTKATFYPFHVYGGEEGEMIESAVMGMVVDAFLSSRVKSHTVSIKVDQDFVEGVKKLVWIVPGFQEHGFWWPFESRVAKFTEKEFIGDDFLVIWDGHGFEGAELTEVEH